MLYKGQVQKIQEKNGKSQKTGKPYTLYSLVLDTAAGTVYLGTGFDKPSVPPGAIVEVEAEENNRGYIDADTSTIKVLKEESSPAAAPNQVSDGVAAVDKRQRSIVTQNVYGTASRLLDTMVANGLIKFPAATAKNDSYEAYMEALDRTAQHLFNKCVNGLDLVEEETNNTEEEGEYDPLS